MDNFSYNQPTSAVSDAYRRRFRHDVRTIIFGSLLMLMCVYADDLILLLLNSENIFTDTVLKLIYGDLEKGRQTLNAAVSSPLFINILSVIVQLIMLFIPAVVTRKLLKSKPTPLFPLKAELPERPLAFIGITFGSCYTVNLFCSLLFGSFYPNIGALSITDSVFEFISIVIIAPICEEFVFRGIFFRSLESYDRRFAIILTAIIFGLMHRNPAAVINAVVFGIFAAVSCAETGSLLMGILLHMTNNAIAFTASSLLNTGESTILLVLPLSLFMLITVFSSFALIVDCRVTGRRIIAFSHPTAYNTPRIYVSHKLAAIFFNPWTWLFAVLLAYSIWLLY